MPKRGWLVVLLLALVGGWMTFDGARALVVGDYVTFGGGARTGELGPWSGMLEFVGIPPRSTFMKLFFVVQGLLTLGAALRVFSQKKGAWVSGLIASICALWYLPFGTLAGVLAIVLLVTWPVKKRK